MTQYHSRETFRSIETYINGVKTEYHSAKDQFGLLNQFLLCNYNSTLRTS